MLRDAGYNRTQIANQLKAVPTYWGDQPLTAPYYAGTFTVLLFILGIILLPKEQKVWLITIAVLGIVLSWGKNFESFNGLLFDYLPGYNKFRSVTFTIIITMFAMNLLGFVALEKLIQSEWEVNLRKKIYLLFGIGGGILLLAVVFSGALSYRGAVDAQLPDWFADAIKEDRRSLLIKDSLRSLIFVTSFAALVWAIFKKKAKATQVVLGLVILVFTDSFSLSKRFLGNERFKKDPSGEYFKPSQSDQALITQVSPGERVLNLQNPFNENRTSYYHESIGGYHGAKIRRYQDLIDYCIRSEIQSAYQKLQSQSTDFSDLSVINMLNTKAFYAGTQQNAVFRNRNANGAAWTVRTVVPVESPDEEIANVCSIDSKTEAIVDESKFTIPAISGSGTITLVEKTPNRLNYSANISGGDALGVFSEVYYPEGWKATIDGSEVEILRANYVLRALQIPPGEHEIVFEFRPQSYYFGNTVMMVSSTLLFFCFLAGIALQLLKIPIANELG
ncbi:MAG: YfhO family protein [Ekhidna sp.]|nr:YfhO family protein [Ekhidna sp.]